MEPDNQGMNTFIVSEELNNSQKEPVLSKKNLIAIGVVIALLTILIIGYYTFNSFLKKPQTKTDLDNAPVDLVNIYEKFDYLIKRNQQDKYKGDVYIRYTNSGKEVYFTSIDDLDLSSDISTISASPKKNLYITRKIGIQNYYDENGNVNGNSNWTDELWRYNTKKEATKLYSNPGLFYEINDNEDTIAIIESENSILGANLVLIDSTGLVLKKFTKNDLLPKSDESLTLGFNCWNTNDLWVESYFGPSLTSITRVNTIDFSIDKYEANLGIDYDFNPNNLKVIYSNYPVLLDLNSANEFYKKKTRVTLYLYDLVTKKQSTLATSITKKFEPKWIDENTIEYESPQRNGRIRTNLK